MESIRPPRRWRNRELQREVDRGHAGWMWGLLAGVIAAAIPTGFYLHHQNECLKLDSEIKVLQIERVRLHERHRRLSEEQATLASPARTEAWSLDNGMVRPSPEQVVVVRPARSEQGELLAEARP